MPTLASHHQTGIILPCRNLDLAAVATILLPQNMEFKIPCREHQLAEVVPDDSVSMNG
jgi:hypothetical protein